MRTPLDENVKYLREIPYTLSFVIQKRIQIDNLNEIPKDKRPTETMIWIGTSKDIENWLDKVYKRSSGKNNREDNLIKISLEDIE